MGAQRALGRWSGSGGDLEVILIGLVDRLARRLRAARRVCRTITVRLRFRDFSRATRSRTLPESTGHTQPILEAGRELLAQAMPLIERRGITLIGVALGNLDDDGAVQLALGLSRERRSSLDVAVDDIRDRFGSAAITRAVLLGREPGITVPLLPD
jgi:DNA polymerase-4